MILAIYGAGGLGREIYEIASRRNKQSKLWSNIVFIEDFDNEGGYFGTKRIRFDTLVKNKEKYECIIGVGEPSAREKLFSRLIGEKIKVAKLIDPTSTVSPTSIINDGAVICEYVAIHSQVELGYNVLIQPSCVVGHDIKVGDHTVMSAHCAPGGSSVFGKRVFIGMQSTLIESLTIGDDAIIAMGSVVFQNVPLGATVVGNPARMTIGNDTHKVFK